MQYTDNQQFTINSSDNQQFTINAFVTVRCTTACELLLVHCCKPNWDVMVQCNLQYHNFINF